MADHRTHCVCVGSGEKGRRELNLTKFNKDLVFLIIFLIV